MRPEAAAAEDGSRRLAAADTGGGEGGRSGGPLRLLQHSLAAKLYLTLLTLLGVLLSVVLGISLLTKASLEESSRELGEALRVKELAVRSMSLLYKQDDITKAMLLDPANFDQAVAKIEAYDENLKTFEEMAALSDSPEILGLIRQLRGLDAEALKPLDTQILEMMAAEDLGPAKRLYFTEYEPVRARYEGHIRELGTVAETLAEGARDRMAARNRRAFFDLLLSVTAAVLLVAVVFLVAIGKVRRKLAQMIQVIQAVARGDLTRQLDAGPQDELGRMAASFNQMVRDLREMMGEIQEVSQRLTQSSGRISADASETSSSVVQLNVAIEQITDGAQEQARAASETAEIMEGMSASVYSIVQSAGEMAASSDETLHAANRGGETVQEAIHSMEEIRLAVRDSAEKVRTLGGYSLRVEEIIRAISEIADQTNLLSLNAAIEAARAGEQGRGFAVVADEVRKLAERSATSAKEIAQLVRNMQQGMNGAVSAMEAGTEKVESGTELARNAVGALEEILRNLRGTHHQIGSVAESARQIMDRTERVSASIQEVASIAEESAASAEEMSAQSIEVSAGIERIADVSAQGDDARGTGDPSTRSLLRLSEQLQQLVLRFSI
ncbi:MAG TPA: HAMP domain-containing methyl-accepting chemotaxis protein [Longimicrobiaceae bacterium]|nr:HAMP domain-containing methyl-accepting chemotaxis protein [Longimicrobiaceae bacterium]